MDNSLSALFSWNFLLFSLGIAALVWFIRTVLEYFYPKIDGNQLWEKLIFPLMPLIFVAVIAIFAVKYPFPEGVRSFIARLLFVSVSGSLGWWLYHVIK